MGDTKRASLYRIVFLVLSFTFIIILSINLIRNFGSNVSSVSFQSFLQYMTTCPQINISNIVNLSIGGDWGPFDFLRNFLNSICAIISFALWVAVQLINCLSYIFYFVRFIFV